jgi:hypothetical protein
MNGPITHDARSGTMTWGCQKGISKKGFKQNFRTALVISKDQSVVYEGVNRCSHVRSGEE